METSPQHTQLHLIVFAGRKEFQQKAAAFHAALDVDGMEVRNKPFKWIELRIINRLACSNAVYQKMKAIICFIKTNTFE